MCMKKCLSLKVCKSVNIYPDSLGCELFLQDSVEASNGIVTSSSGMTIDAVDIPKEYGGECKDHSCLIHEQCIEKKLGGYTCIGYEFCTGPPPTYGDNIFTIDKSKGVPVATYWCPEGSGYHDGERHSYCDPIADTWSSPTSTCATGIPNGCGFPPPISVPHGITRHYMGDLFKAIYTCPSVTDPEPLEHCPITSCTGVKEWTPGANLSCSAKDCYTATTYDGRMTCTNSGRTCQRWDQQKPHAHLYFVTRSDFKNYCRVSIDQPNPWCFTTDILLRWEFCPIPKC
ncbi:uncharacterized protein [Argopecten irradians]|uniref:uncharacterized protein n=1 Tax=Argopecten irradians TaxID=31199 RepID=UPI0037190DB5